MNNKKKENIVGIANDTLLVKIKDILREKIKNEKLYNDIIFLINGMNITQYLIKGSNIFLLDEEKNQSIFISFSFSGGIKEINVTYAYNKLYGKEINIVERKNGTIITSEKTVAVTLNKNKVITNEKNAYIKNKLSNSEYRKKTIDSKGKVLSKKVAYMSIDKNLCLNKTEEEYVNGEKVSSANYSKKLSSSPLYNDRRRKVVSVCDLREKNDMPMSLKK